MKKILMILLAVLFAVSPVLAADDISGTSYETEARVLSALSIMGGYKDGSFKPDDYISRAEFAMIMARFVTLGEEPGGYNGKAYFADVPLSNPAAASIYMLADRGIVPKGVRFRPNEAQTAYDAVRAILNALGYGEEAASKGGYPDGYINLAASFGILKGAAVTSDSVGTTRGNIARLLFNALDVKYYLGDSITTEETQLDRLHITTGTGYVRATDKISTFGFSAVGKGRAVIQSTKGEIYTVYTGANDVSETIGISGKYYLKLEDGEYYLLYFGASSAADDLIIDAGSIEAVGNGYIEYEINDKIKRANYDAAKLTVIYNGTDVKTGDLKAYLWPEIGEVRLVGSSSGGYDTAYVWSYEAYIVDAVNVSDQKIIMKNSLNSKSSILLNDYTDCELVKDGKEISVSDIKQWDVIHLAESYDKESAVIEVSSGNKFSGNITGFGEDTVIVDKTEYEIDLRIKASGLYPTLKIGGSAVFYYNKSGRIFAWNTDPAASTVYGYFTAYKKDSLGNKLRAQIYTMNGVFETYELEERVTVNDIRCQADNIENCPELFNGGTLKDQLVEYKLSASGKLSEITTAAELSSSDGYDESNFTMVLKNVISQNADESKIMTIDHFNNGKFNDTYVSTADTKVVVVPSSLNRDYFEVTSVSGAFTNNSKYRDNKPLDIGEVYLYNSNRYFQVPLIVVKTASVTDTASINTDSPVMLVDECSEMVDSSGNVRMHVSGIYNGARVSYPFSDNINIDPESVKKGMGLQIRVEKNEIRTAKVLFSIEENLTKDYYVRAFDNVGGENENVGWHDNLLIFYGLVTDKSPEGDQLVITTGQSWDHYRGFYCKNVKVYRYNKRTGKADVASYSDLICSQGSPAVVMIRAYRSLVKELIIID